jgi:prepilin-type N-terminal cleavage/methylation domain-containing protein
MTTHSGANPAPTDARAAGPRAARRAAFTLVELLVVITIIAVLLGLTLPALSGTRETSRRLKCLTNLKGLGVGLAAYMNDSNELLPRVRPLHDPNGNTNDISLLDVMVVYLSVPAPVRSDPNNPNSPFVNVSEVFICPSDKTGKDAATNFAPLWQTSGTSYEYLAGEFMWALEQLTVPDPQAAVTQTYKQPRWRELAVMLDNDDWHTGRRVGLPRNALYYGDWRADWAGGISKFDAQDPRMRDLLCDMVSRFGGRPVPGCN